MKHKYKYFIVKDRQVNYLPSHDWPSFAEVYFHYYPSFVAVLGYYFPLQERHILHQTCPEASPKPGIVATGQRGSKIPQKFSFFTLILAFTFTLSSLNISATTSANVLSRLNCLISFLLCSFSFNIEIPNQAVWSAILFVFRMSHAGSNVSRDWRFRNQMHQSKRASRYHLVPRIVEKFINC